MLRGLQELPASRRSIPTLYPAGQRVLRSQRCKTLGGDYLARQVGFEESENYVYYELDGAHALMSGQMRLRTVGPDSPGQREPCLADDRPRDPRLCYSPELSPRATRSSSS